MRLFLGTVLIAFSLSFISCGGSAPADAADMTNAAQGVWKITKIVNSNGSDFTYPGTSIKIGRYKNLNCSTIDYYYKISGNNVTIYAKISGAIDFTDYELSPPANTTTCTLYGGSAYEKNFTDVSSFNGTFILFMEKIDIVDKYFNIGVMNRKGTIQVSGSNMIWKYNQYHGPEYTFYSIREFERADESDIAGAVDKIWQ